MSNSLLESPGTLRPILKLAAPVLAEELLNMLVGYTDWWLTGHFLQGPPYKAAMGLMGIGGMLAIIGGFMFVIVVAKAVYSDRSN